ncbi:MAG: flagellar basal body L-ring protein FlgH [Betaproteobacteria bacterium]|nr:flagellar basal body L-ring protein FlgH [Betaproteobacteria bacterium]MBK7791279.1 flagellar basal body L-ring protein FlgH [Betaproteobacteria bacterium]MBK8687364.1 flagellar basal body L-ring protein FlgH [Betaproteobacteria bacterium]MBK9676478.1 flagellar basal body L-ring protein FlgH [Betaproteobacteria bacterium]
MNLSLVPLRHPGLVRGVARVLAGLAVAAALSGCVAPWRMVEVREPLTAHPIVATIPPAANGAIFQQASYEPLFQDRRARRVGDTLTVQINEKLFASKKAATTATRTGNSSLSIPEIKGWPGVSVKGATVKGESNNEFEGKGASGSDNTFTGTITLTVIEVLPNGNLFVSGEKQIGINQGSEFVRVSGIVNPINILPGNVVTSTLLADARLEYRGTGYVDEAQNMGWLQRLYQVINPF